MNYTNTLITVAADCPVATAGAPAAYRGKATVAAIQYELLAQHPYQHTQEDVLFETYLRQNGLDLQGAEREALRAEFFGTPHACLRASPLPKQYGWGLHFDGEGRVALCAVESAAYAELAASGEVTRLPAMRRSRG